MPYLLAPTQTRWQHEGRGLSVVGGVYRVWKYSVIRRKPVVATRRAYCLLRLMSGMVAWMKS